MGPRLLSWTIRSTGVWLLLRQAAAVPSSAARPESLRWSASVNALGGAGRSAPQ
jgi:hypothetical protein